MDFTPAEDPSLSDICNYQHKWRVKPREPREVWINEYSCGLSDFAHASKEKAKTWANPACVGIRRFREVVE